VVGFEANGGFLLGSDLNWNGRKLDRLPTRDAVLPMLVLLAISQDLGCKLSELVNYIPSRFTFSDRIQGVSPGDSIDLLNSLAGNLDKAKCVMAPNSGDVASVDMTDGLRITFSNGDIVHLRPSGNAPELRCYAESSNQQSAVDLCRLCLSRLT